MHTCTCTPRNPIRGTPCTGPTSSAITCAILKMTPNPLLTTWVYIMQTSCAAGLGCLSTNKICLHPQNFSCGEMSPSASILSLPTRMITVRNARVAQKVETFGCRHGSMRPSPGHSKLLVTATPLTSPPLALPVRAQNLPGPLSNPPPLSLCWVRVSKTSSPGFSPACQASPLFQKPFRKGREEQ